MGKSWCLEPDIRLEDETFHDLMFDLMDFFAFLLKKVSCVHLTFLDKELKYFLVFHGRAGLRGKERKMANVTRVSNLAGGNVWTKGNFSGKESLKAHEINKTNTREH